MLFERLVYEGGASSCHGAVGPSTPRVRRGDIFKNGKSVTFIQRKFRLHFNVARHARLPSRNTILLWVRKVRTMASATKKKQGGSARTVRTPENVEALRNAVQQSPRRSAVCHAQALRLSDTTVRRILHKDFNFHPYKLMLVQELNQQDFGRRTPFTGPVT
jgi:uncharacterized protein YlaI